jgi:hypothetical protein
MSQTGLQMLSSRASEKLNDGGALFVINGSPAVGNILAAVQQADDPDGNGSGFAYSWYSSQRDGDWSIVGNDASYVVKADDEGKDLRLRVSYIDGQGFLESTTSPTVAVPLVNRGTASFSINGSPAVGTTLTAQVKFEDPDGYSTALSYRWQSGSIDSTWVDVGIANSYTAKPSDQARELRLIINYTDGRGFQESLTLAAGTVPDVVPVLSIDAKETQVLEGNDGSTLIRFLIQASGYSNKDCSVAWFARPIDIGKARADRNDFENESWPSGQVVFAPGETSKEIEIRIRPDRAVEQNESFIVTLGSPTSALIDQEHATAKAMIINDDSGYPRLSKPLGNQIVEIQKPFAITIPSTTFFSESLSDLRCSATMGDGSPLPAWIRFDPGSRTFFGTPTQAGQHNITITATDDQQRSISDTFILSTRAASRHVGYKIDDGRFALDATNSRAYVVSQSGSQILLKVFNLSPGSLLTELGTIALPDHVQDITIDGDKAWILSKTGRLDSYSIANPLALQFDKTIATGLQKPSEILVNSTHLFVIADAIYKIDKNNLSSIASYRINYPYWMPIINDSIIVNQYLITENQVFNLQTGTWVGWLPGTYTYTYGLARTGNYLFANGTNGLRVYDLSKPLTDALATIYQLPGISNPLDNTSYGISKSMYVEGSLLYLSTFSSGIQILDVSDPRHLTLLGTVPNTGEIAITNDYILVLSSSQLAAFPRRGGSSCW